MRRRLLIARALVSAPKLLFLDEPTTGLDPQVRHHIWERIGQLKSRGVTLVLTTHYMEEAERLCDRLVVMNEGRIVASGSPRSLIAEHATPEVVEVYLNRRGTGASTSSEEVIEIARPLSQRQVTLGDRVVLYTQDARVLAEALRPRDCLLRHGSLEDVFLQLTGRGLTE
jgi:lipooligosaccharide transport system ATP-binding protein